MKSVEEKGEECECVLAERTEKILSYYFAFKLITAQ